MIIEINDKKYPLKFGYGAYKRICNHYGYTKMGELAKLLVKIDFKEGEEPSFDQLDFLGVIIKSGIEFLTPSAEINPDEAVDVIIRNSDLATNVLKLFTASIPSNNGGKPKGQK